MDKKKILIFSTAYYPFVGGAEVAVKEITDHLGNDFDFDLITARMRKDLPSFEKIGEVNVYRVGFGNATLDKLLLPFLGALKVRNLQNKLAKTENYFCFWAIMITFGSGAAYIYNIFSSIFGRKKIPIVLTLQEGDSEEHLKFRWAGLLALSWKMALKYANFLTGLSSFLIYRAERFKWNGPSCVVPNGVNISVFSRTISDIDKEKMMVLLGKKPNEIFLVTTSRLAKKNAVDDIISSLIYLPENISLIIIGKGEEGTKLQSQVRKLNLSGRVKFIGFVTQEEIPEYFSICNIFVRPSRSEGFGNSFIEAMAAHLPVIATPVGGIVDFLDDKETGIFCSPNNPQSVAQSVKFILENKELRSKITDQAYNMVVSKFSWESISEKMKNKVFNQIK